MTFSGKCGILRATVRKGLAMDKHKVAKIIFDMKEEATIAKSKQELIEELKNDLPSCPFCGCMWVYRNGRDIVLTCQECGAYFYHRLNDGRTISQEEYVLSKAESYLQLEENKMREVLKAVEEIRNSRILPCPNCGFQDCKIHEKERDRVCCNRCQTLGPKADKQESAIRKWNNRHGKVNQEAYGKWGK